MKNKIYLVTFLIILLFPVTASTNSTPVYMESYPSFAIAPMEDSPIRVDREELSIKVGNHSSEGMVIARYTLTNISSENIRLPMIFPLISDGYRGSGIGKIEYNGKEVEFEKFGAGYVSIRDYLKDPEEFSKQADINEIIKNLNKPLYEAKYFDDNDYAVLYEVTLKEPFDRQIKINFSMDIDETRVLTHGFNGFGFSKNGECYVSRYVNENAVGEKAYILVIGEDTLNDIESNYEDIIEKSTVIIKDFILAHSFEEDEWYDTKNRNVDNFYSMFIREIDNFIESSQPAFTFSMVMENLNHTNNISVLLYEVEFDGESTNILEVAYPIRATIDREKTNDYINTFAYILNPARNFIDFGELDIIIELNSNDPYIIESSISLENEKKGIYTGSFEGLPDVDLVFSTYSTEEVTFIDRTSAQILPRGYPRVFAGFAGIIVLVIFAVFKLIKRVRG